MERDCEACNFRESNIGYPSPCPAHEKKETSTTPNEREDWSKRCLDIAVMADKGKDYAYGKALATLSIDIEKAISRTRQEEREKVVEYIRNQFNLVVNVEPEEGMFSVHQMELEEILKEARKLT